MRRSPLSDATDKARYLLNSSNLVRIIFKSWGAHYVAWGKPGDREGKWEKSRGIGFQQPLWYLTHLKLVLIERLLRNVIPEINTEINLNFDGPNSSVMQLDWKQLRLVSFSQPAELRPLCFSRLFSLVQFLDEKSFEYFSSHTFSPNDQLTIHS